MSEPVVIPIVAEGVAKLMSELRTVDQTLAEMERRSTRAAEAGARQRTNTTRAAANDQKKAWLDVAKQAEALEKQKAKIAENSARMAGQLAKRQADQEIKEADRAARDKIRATERAERERQRIIDNSANMAGRIAEREANREIAEMKRIQDARARFLTGMAGKASSSVSRVARGGLTMLGASTTLGAGYAVADAARDEIATERSAQILANTAVVPGKKAYSKKELIDLAGSTARTTNIAKADVIGGLQAFTDISGDLDAGISGAGFAAKVAKGQGADFKEVMQTMGTLQVQNPKLDQRGLQNLLSGIVGGARIGAISSKSMAEMAGAITSTSGSYAGDQATAQRHLLGLAQLTRPFAEGDAEAATAVTRMTGDLLKHSKKTSAAGINIFKKGTNQLRDLSEILPEIMLKTGGNEGKMAALGIEDRSIKVMRALTPTFNAAGGGEAGAKDVAKQIKKFEDASVSVEEVERNFGDVMNTTAEKFDHAAILIQQILEQKLAPWLDKIADKLPEWEPKIEELINGAAHLAEWFADNPLKGIGGVVLAAVTKDIGDALIGQGIKAALETKIGGIVGSGLTIAAAAITAEQVGELVINQLAKADADRNRHAVGGEIAAANAISSLHRPGGAKPEDIATARKTLDELTATVGQQKAEQDGLGALALKGALLGPGNMVLGPAMIEREKKDAAQLAANEAALKELTAALKAATAAQGGGGNSAGGSGYADPARNRPLTDPARGGGH